MSPTQSIDLSPEALLPDLGTGTRISTWFSFCRNNYSRGRGGLGIGPSASDFRCYWRNSWRFSPEHFDMISRWTLDDYVRWLEQHFQPFSYAYMPEYRTYCQVLAAMNAYVAGIRMIEPHRRVKWQVHYIAVVGDDYYYGDRMEAKFHGRCLLNIKVSSWRFLQDAITRGNWSTFWGKIVEIYNNTPYNRRLANPSYLREAANSSTPRATPRQPTPRPSTRYPRTNPAPEWMSFDPPRASPPPPATLQTEYSNRSNPSDLDVISTAELARMIASAANLPSSSKKTIYDMILAAQLFDDSAVNFADTSV